MRILVVGTGYVGLVTGACFAEMGHHVICLDIDSEKIDHLTHGMIPFYEPGLEELVKRNVADGRLEFTTDYAYGVARSFICFIAVSTPATESGAADITHVKQAAKMIAEQMDDYKIIIHKSTVPVGSAQEVSKIIDATLKERGYVANSMSSPIQNF